MNFFDDSNLDSGISEPGSSDENNTGQYPGVEPDPVTPDQNFEGGNVDYPPYNTVDLSTSVEDLAEALWGNLDDNNLGTIWGEPGIDSDYWHMQNNPDTCAIVSQEYILDRYYPEREFTEHELVSEAIDKGYYYPGSGTYPQDVGNLLEDHGIEVERTDGNQISDIKEKLVNNQKIIVAVDSNEIWCNSEEEQLKDLFFMPEADHAVEVIGYDEEAQKVILNDPGHPNGRKIEVSINDFESAWDDSNCYMVWTKNSPDIDSA